MVLLELICGLFLCDRQNGKTWDALMEAGGYSVAIRKLEK